MNVRTGNKQEVTWILNTLIGIPIVLKNEYERWEYGVVLKEFKDGKLNLSIDESIDYLVKLDGILN